MIDRRRLLDMGAGERGVVFEVVGGHGLRRRLESLGVRPGMMIEKMTGSPFGGPVVIRIGRARFAIGSGMASKVIVEVQEAGST